MLANHQSNFVLLLFEIIFSPANSTHACTFFIVRELAILFLVCQSSLVDTRKL